MNQILVTEKLYITPELKKKKKVYQVCFILCIIAMIVLIGMYTYANYDRMKSEELSEGILANMFVEDDTMINEEDNALIVSLTREQMIEENMNNTVYGDAEEKQENQGSQNVTSKPTEEDKNNIKSGQFKAANGQIYNIIGIINIPKINAKFPIISESSVAYLKVSACKFWGPNANEVGNLVVVGHNYKNNTFFSNVPKLEMGDIVEITDLNGITVKYEVYDMYTVDPTDTRCTSQLTQGRREVTVITCTDNGKQRVVVKCREKI